MFIRPMELPSEGYPVAKLLERLEETRDLQQPDLNKPLPSLHQQFKDDMFYVYRGPFTPSPPKGCLLPFMKPHKATPAQVPASEWIGTVQNKGKHPDVVLWSLDGKTQTKMLNGDKVTVMDEIDNKYKVKWNDQVGFVKKW